MRRAAILLVFLAVVPAASAQPPSGVTANVGSGSALYAANCSSCHGPQGQGIRPPGLPGVGGVVGMGPSLRNVGAGTVDFYLRTGYMPLGKPNEQPTRTHVFFSARQIRALIHYVASFGHGPPIPNPQPERGSLSEGLHLFTEHCAGCHQVVARGGVVTGARAPSLERATTVQIAEAVRSGPFVMPRFSPKAITNHQLDSIVRYVEFARDPPNPGGWGIDFIGPLPEGLVTGFIAMVALVAACVVFGSRRTDQ